MGDLVFLTPAEKFEAVLDDIRDCRKRGQPDAGRYNFYRSFGIAGHDAGKGQDSP
jgi:hypothetical protein